LEMMDQQQLDLLSNGGSDSRAGGRGVTGVALRSGVADSLDVCRCEGASPSNRLCQSKAIHWAYSGMVLFSAGYALIGRRCARGYGYKPLRSIPELILTPFITPQHVPRGIETLGLPLISSVSAVRSIGPKRRACAPRHCFTQRKLQKLAISPKQECAPARSCSTPRSAGR